ncbi:MAG: 3D domain-containing protein [Firmicutes bacterium]|nr:3D domain-containing protein [Bacillota bacterium]
MKKLATLLIVAVTLVTSLAFPPELVSFMAAEEKLNVTIRVDLLTIGTKTVWPDTTVEQILAQLQDEQNLSLVYKGSNTRQVKNGETINLKTQRTRLVTERVSMPYEIYKNRTNSVWEDSTHVRQAGLAGERMVTTEIIYIGGVEQSRQVVRELTLVEPVNAIVDVGTARLGALTNVTAPDFHYVRRVRMEATAYTAGFGCTGKRPGDPGYRITASGRRVEHGIVAVDRRIIPLGTRLYVEGYGFAIAADVGGAIRGYRIDLFMESLQDALNFGRRDLYVWILD